MHVNEYSGRDLVLIGGSQRSGTTLVQTLLCNLTGSLPVWPEAHHVHDQICSYDDADKLWNKSEFYFKSKDDMQRFYQDTVQSIITRGLDRGPVSGPVILKDPRFSGIVHAVIALFPHAHMVCCIRDPRDVVSSYLQIRERERGRSLSTTERRNEIVKAAERYRRAYLRDDGFVDNVVPVYYEQVVERPAEIIGKVARKCGLMTQAEGVEALEWAPENERHQPAWITELEGRAPSAREVGKFRRVMNTREIARVEWICHAEMARYGYDPYGPAKSWNRLRAVKRNLVSRDG